MPIFRESKPGQTSAEWVSPNRTGCIRRSGPGEQQRNAEKPCDVTEHAPQPISSPCAGRPAATQARRRCIARQHKPQLKNEEPRPCAANARPREQRRARARDEKGLNGSNSRASETKGVTVKRFRNLQTAAPVRSKKTDSSVLTRFTLSCIEHRIGHLICARDLAE